MSFRGGIDLGGTKIQAVVVNERHEAVGQARRFTPLLGGPEAVAQEMAVTMFEALKSAGIESQQLQGVGVGSPGVVDAVDGTVTRAGNVRNWTEPFPLAAVLSEAFGVPVYLGNDVGVAVDGETMLGAGRAYGSFLGVYWGTGIGGGVVLRRRRWLGRGAAGEFGHLVVRRRGALCPCGRRGCVEAYAGRRAMEERARRELKKGTKTNLFELMERRGRTALTSGVWAKALEQQDKLAIRLIDRAVAALAAGIASVVNLLDLEAVVIGGGLGTRLGHPYAERIAHVMLPHLFVPERPPAVVTAALGDLGGAIGASLLVLEAQSGVSAHDEPLRVSPPLAPIEPAPEPPPSLKPFVNRPRV